MSDKDNEDTGTPEDPIKNLKAEFNRKLDHQSKQMTDLMAANVRLSTQLSQIAKPAATQAQHEEDDEEFDAYDPKSVKKAIDKAVNKQVGAKADEFMEQQRRQSALQELGVDYPELGDGNSDLSKLAVQVFETLNPNLRASAEGYKLAVREAAAKLGVMPMNKRNRNDRQDDDSVDEEFTSLPGRSGAAGSSNRASKKKETELDPDTLASAQLMGLDTSDPKVVARLKKHAQRKNWGRYGG